MPGIFGIHRGRRLLAGALRRAGKGRVLLVPGAAIAIVVALTAVVLLDPASAVRAAPPEGAGEGEKAVAVTFRYIDDDATVAITNTQPGDSVLIVGGVEDADGVLEDVMSGDVFEFVVISSPLTNAMFYIGPPVSPTPAPNVTIHLSCSKQLEPGLVFGPNDPDVGDGTHNIVDLDSTDDADGDGDGIERGDAPFGLEVLSVMLGKDAPSHGDCIAGSLEHASIIIKKITIGGDDTFDYTSAALGNFQLTTAGNIASTTYSGLAPGAYDVSEDDPTASPGGWDFTNLQCTDPSSDTVVTLGTRSATIELAAGETVTCTFTNTVTTTEQASIIIKKITIGGDDTFDYTTATLPGGNFQLTTAGNMASTTYSGLAPGVYDVSEDDPTASPGGWDFTNLQCTDPSSDTVVTLGTRSAAIELAAGETVTCTFTNTVTTTEQASIIIKKITIGGDDTFDYTTATLPGGNFQLTTAGNMASTTYSGLAPGAYDVSEDDPTASPGGWDFTNLQCTDPSSDTVVTLGTRSAAIELAAGETVTCTFTNDDIVVTPGPNIRIEKATNGQDADSPTGPQILVGGTATFTYVVTNTGDVKLTEVTVTDNQLGAITCTKSELAAGESMTCTASTTVVAGQYANTGMVTGTPPEASDVTDFDLSHHFGFFPPPPPPEDVTITIIKLVTTDGNATGPAAGTQFEFDLDCIGFDQTFSLADGESQQATSAANTQCSLAETNTQDADSVDGEFSNVLISSNRSFTVTNHYEGVVVLATAISKTLITADPVAVGEQVDFEISVSFVGTTLPDAEFVDIYENAFLEFISLSEGGVALACTVSPNTPDAAHDTVVCPAGEPAAATTVTISFRALQSTLPGSTINEANVVYGDPATTIGPAFDDVQIVEVLVLPRLGDGPVAGSTGSTSSEAAALLAGLAVALALAGRGLTARQAAARP